MNEVKFVPDCAKGKSALFDGHVVLKKPTVMEALKGAELGRSLEDGSLEKLGELLEWTKPFYVSVDIKSLEDNSEYKTFDELMSDSSCLVLLQEVMTKLLGGITRKK